MDLTLQAALFAWVLGMISSLQNLPPTFSNDSRAKAVTNSIFRDRPIQATADEALRLAVRVELLIVLADAITIKVLAVQVPLMTLMLLV